LQVIHQTPTTTLSTNQDVACNVPQHIYEKIIKSEYIDLATLLVTNYDTQTHSIVMHDGKLALQSHRTAKIHSIDQWTSVFLIFTSIYCRVHVSRFQELLKYMHLVRLASSRYVVGNMGWKNYDEQFRLRKVSDPSNSWGVVDTELWLLYIGSGNINTTSQFAGSRGSASHSNLKCYSFNYTGNRFRQVCHFGHFCLNCGKTHPLINCWARNSTRQGVNPNMSIANSNNYNNNHGYSFRQPQHNPPQRPGHHVLDKGLSPINIDVLQKLLSGYPSDLAKKLFEGFSKGFKLQYTGPRRQMLSRNLVSA